MELFVVKNRNGAIVAKDFVSKSVAKGERDRLQAESKKGLPAKESRGDHTVWDFFVSFGKDHLHFA